MIYIVVTLVDPMQQGYIILIFCSVRDLTDVPTLLNGVIDGLALLGKNGCQPRVSLGIFQLKMGVMLST